MIKVYGYINDLEFIEKYKGLDNTNWNNEREALGILYDYLEGMGDEALDDMTIRDWLRFEVVEMTTREIKESYNISFNDYQNVVDFLNYKTVLYGTYEYDGETYYLFNGEF